MSERAQKLQAERRRLIKFAGASLFLLVSPVGRAAVDRNPSILAVRVWPAADYTRVTIECSSSLKYSHFTIKNPDRLVVDLEGIEFSSVLESLSNKIAPDDPNIKLLRAGRFKPGVVRLVMELKNEVKPQVFELPPVGEYGHRLVLDVYPLEAPDPLLQLLAKNEAQSGNVPSLDEKTPEPSTEIKPEKPRPTPVMAVKIRVPSDAAAATRKTSRSRSPSA
jgi:N-acetylmuramoyl-L-alanine amidase